MRVAWDYPTLQSITTRSMSSTNEPANDICFLHGALPNGSDRDSVESGHDRHERMWVYPSYAKGRTIRAVTNTVGLHGSQPCEFPLGGRIFTDPLFHGVPIAGFDPFLDGSL